MAIRATLMFMVLSFAIAAYSQDIHPSNCIYTVYVKTSDIHNAGTDAKVKLTLFDNQNRGFTVEDLERYGAYGSNYDYFEKGHLDVFAFRSICLPSRVCGITLSHDGAGSHPKWHVDHLEINTAQPQTACNHQNFGIQQWLDDDSVTRRLCSGTSNDEISTVKLPIFPLEPLIKSVV